MSRMGLSRLSGGSAKKLSLLVANMLASMIGLTLTAVLTDSDFFASVVFVLSFSGLISAVAASNNSSMIFSSMAEADDEVVVRYIAIRLFRAEQVSALLAGSIGLLVINSLDTEFHGEPLALLFCGIVSSNTAALAYSKVSDEVFVGVQFFRLAGVILRTILLVTVFLIGKPGLLEEAVILAFSIPYIGAVKALLQRPGGHADIDKSSFNTLIREYVLGVPSALIRSIANSGVLLFSTSVLSPEDVRTFRFLYLPREYFGRLFGMLLPLTFSSIYRHVLSVKTLILASLVSVFAFGATFVAVNWALGVGGVPVFLYLAWGALVGAAYAVSSLQWKDVYHGKQVWNLLVTLPGFFGAIVFYSMSGLTPDTAYIISGLLIFFGSWVSMRILVSGFRGQFAPFSK